METNDTMGQQPAPTGETAPAPAPEAAPEASAEQTAETTAAADGATPEETTEATAETKPEAAPEPKRKPWWEGRIEKVTAEKYNYKSRAEAAEAALAAALAQREQPEGQQAAPETPAAPAKPETPLTPSQIEARAQQIVQQRAFDEACNKTHAAGMKEFPDDFAKAMNIFGMLGGIPIPALEAVTDMPDGHKVLHELGKTPDEAERIFALPAAKMVRELTRIETNLAKPAKVVVSAAPKPITPIDGGARVETDPEKMDMNQFSKWFDARQEARGKARYG